MAYLIESRLKHSGMTNFSSFRIISMDDSTILKKIDSGIRFFLYLLIFWLPYSKAVVESSVVIALVLWIVKRGLILRRFHAIDKKKLLRMCAPAGSFLNGPITIFLIFGMVSALTSTLFLQSLHGYLTKILEWFIIYFLILEVFTTKKHIRIAFIIFLFTSISTVLDSLQQFYWTHKDIFLGYVVHDNRATGGFNHSNDLAGYLTFVIPVVMVHPFWNKNSMGKFFLGMVLTVLSVWSLVVTFSRGAWLAVAAGVFFFLCFVGRSWRPFIILGIMAFILGTGIFFTTNKKEFRVDAHDVHHTVHWRYDLWEDSLKMILNRPNFGYGPNTFMPTFFDFGRAIRGGGYYTPTYAHNCFIQLAAEMGIFGLGSFLWIVGLLFQKVIVQLKNLKAGDYNLKILSTGMLGGTLAFLGHSFVDTNLFSLQLSALFWMMVGLQVAVYNLQKSSIS